MIIEQIIKENIGVIDHTLPGYQHGDALFIGEQWEPIKKDMIELADDIVRLNPGARKFLDIGCGHGFLAERLNQIGENTGLETPPFTIVTLDGNQETRNHKTLNQKNHFIVRTDEPYRLIVDGWATMIFDVITCFEHFEHIHPDLFPQFIENIKNHMNGDTILYASAAKWNYNDNDRVHVNVKPEFLWKQEMENYGFQEVDKKLFNERNTANCRLRWNETAELVYKLKK